jgi:hypothetical protein
MVANKLVLVVLVPVALVQMRLAMESEPVKVKFAIVHWLRQNSWWLHWWW